MSGLTILAIIAAVVAIPAVFNLVRRPGLRRIAVRNIVRRPTETVLIIVGSALGTAIIVAALMVGDTFDRSIRDIARTDLGEIDISLEVDGPVELAELEADMRAADLAANDGILAVRSLWTAAAGPGGVATRQVEPSVRVSAVNFDEAAQFGSEPNRYGLALSVSPGVTDAVIGSRLADDVDAEVGDTITLFADGQEFPLTVVAVNTSEGLAGYSDVFVQPELFAVADPEGITTYDHLVLSAPGAVFNTEQQRDDAFIAVSEALDAAGRTETPDLFKQDLLDDAEAEGTELTTIFTVVGGFSVLAGVLLLINLFVMLAEERKPNLGVLRAIGWKRAELRRAFRAEGVIYATSAAVIGAILGIGVGWVIVRLTRGILSNANPDSDFELILAVEPLSLLTAGLVGLIIAMAAIWFTSWRISRLNIISAIRDLPEPRNRRSRLLTTGGGVAAMVLGGLMLATGLSSSNPYLTLLSIPIAILGAAMILKDMVSPTLLGGLAGAAAVLWGLLFFVVMPDDITSDIAVEFFLLFGVTVVAGGVAITTVCGPLLQRLLTRSNRPLIEARVAMAYPAARMFRTAASLAMYSLIIFSLAFMAVVSSGIERQADDIAVATASGHDILVTSNRSNPIIADELAALDGVRVVSPTLRNGVDFYADFEPGSEDDPERWGVVGVEPEFASVGAPKLSLRDDRYASDAEALAAVASDPSLVMVPTWFLGDEDGYAPEVGSIVTAVTDDGETPLRVVGVVENDYAWSGAWMSAETVRMLAPESVGNRLYVAVDQGADAEALTDSIERDFLTSGAEAETFVARVQRITEADLGFFSLLQGYLLLGLVIGIAGLAVTLFRAVRERRRQIGMMRAMGLAHGGVRNWFLTEATFVSLMGIVTGVTLGVLTGYLVATQSNAFGDAPLPFGVPWAALLFIVAVPFVASAFAAVVPARRASKLRPSEALRLAD